MTATERPISNTWRERIEREVAAEEAAARRRAEALAPKPAKRPQVLASQRPASLGTLGAPPAESQTGLHEAAHAVIAELLGIRVAAVVAFPDGSGETRHVSADDAPRERALIALGGAVVGGAVGRADPVGTGSDLDVAREAAALVSPADPDAALERLTAEAETMVRDNLQAIGRLADVLERFGGRLAGWQLAAAIDYAFARPAPMPVPGPRDHDARVLQRFARDRRKWQVHLLDQYDEPDEAAQLEAFWNADLLAREMEPPPAWRPEQRARPSEPTATPTESGAGPPAPDSARG